VAEQKVAKARSLRHGKLAPGILGPSIFRRLAVLFDKALLVLGDGLASMAPLVIASKVFLEEASWWTTTDGGNRIETSPSRAGHPKQKPATG